MQEINMVDFVKNYFASFVAVITPEVLTKVIGAVVGVLVFYIVYIISKRLIKKIFCSSSKIKPQISSLTFKILKYIFFVLITVYILGIFGVKLTALFGAAGIAGVAIGFAAQTSFSNIISGFFLLTEHAFKIGDFIVLGDTSGTIDSIDMLSIRIHTLDNQMIRVPNETIIKSNLQNNSYYPIRRFTVDVNISYETDLKKALEVLSSVPARCPLVVSDPAPMAFCNTFKDSGITLTLSVWFDRNNFIDVKNSVYIELMSAFKDANIEIPFPQLEIRERKVKKNSMGVKI